MRFALLLLAIYTTGVSADSFDFRRATDDPQVLGSLQDLAFRGANLSDGQEVAAFIVRDGSGGTACWLWPHPANVRSEHYRGGIPTGTVAVAHTHPLGSEQPSRGDVAESKRIGLPIYVISRWDLYVVDPQTGERVPLIAHKNWMRGGSRNQCRSMIRAEEQQIVTVRPSDSTAQH